MRVIGLMSALVLGIGCSTPPAFPEAAAHHIVMFDRRGHPVQPESTRLQPLLPQIQTKPLRIAATDVPFSGVLDAIEGRRVVIFVHGGVNSPEATIERAKKAGSAHHVAVMPGETEEEPFLVLVAWNSALRSSYAEHLFFTRQGGEVNWLYGALSFPFVLANDLVRGLTRAPVVLATLESREFLELVGFRAARPSEDQQADRIADSLLTHDRRCHIARGLSTDELRPGRLPRWLLNWPVRFAVSPLIEGNGSSAWAVLRRRVKLLFNPETEFKVNGEPGGGFDQQVHSPLVRFLQKLRELQEQHQLRIDVIGHSMGALVVNEMLRLDNRSRGEGEPAAIPKFTRIVYLAAASSVRDYLVS